MENNYEDIPMYHWYLSQVRVEGNNHSIWHKGKQYIPCEDELDPYTMEINRLIYIGYGDINYIPNKF